MQRVQADKEEKPGFERELRANDSRSRVVVVTNNRFWLNRIGSNVRIRSMVDFLSANGWVVGVAFMGWRYPQDVEPIRRMNIDVDFSLGDAAATSQPGGERTVLSASGRVDLLKRLYRWTRAAITQLRRPMPEGGLLAIVSQVSLRAREPRVSDFRDDRYLAALLRTCERVHPDWVLVEYVHLACLVGAVRGKLGSKVRWALDTHDVQHERQARFHKLGEVHDLDISRREEASLMRQFDLVIGIQARDAMLLRAMVPNCNVVCAPHPHALPAERPRTDKDGVMRVGFIGSLMPPNVLAARELVHEIWPAVASLYPRAELLIAGSVCEALVSSELPERVKLLGFVEALDAFYQALSLAVSPIRVGGGLKIKNVEALCHAIPLLTTTIGAEGLEDGADSAFLVEDSKDDLSATLSRLLADGELRARLSRQARAYVQSRFTPDAAYGELLRALLDRLGPSGAGRASRQLQVPDGFQGR